MVDHGDDDDDLAFWFTLTLFKLYLKGCALIALTLLVGHQEEHPVCRNGVMRGWCDYLSGARCRLFAYGPAAGDAVASAGLQLMPLHPETPSSFASLNPDWLYFSGTSLLRLSWKRGR